MNFIYTDILKLLQSQNRCLKKLLEHSKQFQKETDKNDFSNLEALTFYERKIAEFTHHLDKQKKTETFVEAIKNIIENKKNLINIIIKIDNDIILKIEAEKSKLMQELSISEKTKFMVNKFKSKWIAQSGEELDGLL
jgi:hypothetical protein